MYSLDYTMKMLQVSLPNFEIKISFFNIFTMTNLPISAIL